MSHTYHIFTDYLNDQFFFSRMASICFGSLYTCSWCWSSFNINSKLIYWNFCYWTFVLWSLNSSNVRRQQYNLKKYLLNVSLLMLGSGSEENGWFYLFIFCFLKVQDTEMESNNEEVRRTSTKHKSWKCFKSLNKQNLNNQPLWHVGQLLVTSFVLEKGKCSGPKTRRERERAPCAAYWFWG